MRVPFYNPQVTDRPSRPISWAAQFELTPNSVCLPHFCFISVDWQIRQRLPTNKCPGLHSKCWISKSDFGIFHAWLSFDTENTRFKLEILDFFSECTIYTEKIRTFWIESLYSQFEDVPFEHIQALSINWANLKFQYAYSHSELAITHRNLRKCWPME